MYVLVDNRDLTNLDNPDPSLQHWPAVAAPGGLAVLACRVLPQEIGQGKAPRALVLSL